MHDEPTRRAGANRTLKGVQWTTRRPPADAPDGARALRGQEGHRRPGPPARAADRRAAGARPHPRRGRARPGQDDGDQDARRRRSAASSSASSSRRTSSRPTWSAPGSTTRRPASSRRRSGPVFTNLLLADEINRAPAKVQSALLEVMQERQVTIGRETFKVPESVPRPGDPEPDRDRGHLRPARGAGRPVHAQGPRRLPEPDRGVRDRRADDAAAPGRPDGAHAPTSCSPCSRRPTGSTSIRR